MYKMDSYCNSVPMLHFPIRLDLGAGAYPQEGFVKMDMDANADIRWDISTGIPLPNSSVSELFTSHFLEHLIATDCHYVLQEMWRVCANGAKVTIKLPYGPTPEGALPCHYNRFDEASMEAIGQWFPRPGHPDYNGSYWDLKRVWRENYHLLAEYFIVKGAPV